MFLSRTPLVSLFAPVVWIGGLTLSAAEPPAIGGTKPAASIADADLAAWLDARVSEIEPTPAERRFDEIGWTAGILEARRLSQEHDRPMFLFTHDGRMAIGRC